jgi:hypothetical protein
MMRRRTLPERYCRALLPARHEHDAQINERLARTPIARRTRTTSINRKFFILQMAVAQHAEHSGGATPGAAGAVAQAYQLCTSTGMLNFQGKNMIILGD